MEVFLKGIGIGFAIAAPVGPIGLLCMRATLAHGGRIGFATGFGAASADAFYGLLVAVGLTVTGVLIVYAVPMQIGGGLLIAALGFLSIRKFFRNDGENEEATARPRARMLPAYATTLALTLSNPMTIFAFAGLVAGLGGAAAAGAAYNLVIGVFLGSALWWLILVQITLLGRARLSAHHMRLIDLGSGAVLFVWGTWIMTFGVLAAVSV